MALLTAEEMTNWYLYGQKTVPANLADPGLLRPQTATSTTSVDINDYMTTGAGRFASAASFEVVEKFFNPWLYSDSSALTPGTYTKAQMFAALGLNNDINRRIVKVVQAFYDDGKDDFVERAYVWNTTAFKLSDDPGLQFVIDANGHRHIKNFAIVPYSNIKDSNGNDAENFDFKSTSSSSQVANFFLEPNVDPSGIGRTVLISFAGTRTPQSDFTYNDYVLANSTRVDPNPALAARLALSYGSFTDRLFQSGSTRFLDSQNRPIIYGSANADSIQGTKAINADLGSHRQLSAYTGNGITYVTGAGDDTINATNGNDLIIGGANSDRLFGGAGNDEYRYTTGDGHDLIIDGSGNNEIVVNGAALSLSPSTTSSFLDPNNNNLRTWKSDDGQFTYVLLHGDTGSAQGATLEVSGAGMGGGKITISNFRYGQFGLQLSTRKVAAISTSGGNDNPIDRPDYTPETASADMKELGAKTVKVFLNAPAKDGDVIKLSATGSADMSLITGAETLPFGGGDLELALSEGQTEITFSIWNSDAIDSNQAVTLTATLVEATPGTGSPASAALTLNISDDGRPDAEEIQTSRTIVGDLQPVDPPQTDDLGNPITNGAAPNRADMLYDSAGNDLILPGGGNDYIQAFRGGDDVIDTGDGEDQANGGAGNDRIKGGADHDVLRGQADDDTLEGGTGADIAYGHIGEDTLFGEEKVDIQQAITQGASGDSGSGRGEFLQGMDGNDAAIGSNRADLLGGGAGDDVLVGAQGDDYITGDNTYDAFSAEWTVTVQVNDGVTTYIVGGASGVESDGGADAIYAGAGNDGILAGGGDDVVMAEAGNDKAWGEAGADVVVGGDGDDSVSGDNGIQFLAEAEHGDDFVDGGNGNDLVLGNAGNDALFGGAGDDEVFGDSVEQAQGGDDYIDGEDGNDQLGGGGGKDVIYGGAGTDTIAGDSDDTPTEQQSDDQMYGEEGNDILIGYRGKDYLDGGADDDRLFGGNGEDQLTGGDGNDTLAGDDGIDDPAAADADFLDGGAGDDLLFGEAGDDLIDGGAGADQISAGDGDDVASGGDENDLILGDAGNDSLAGDAGDDQLQGGMGDDLLAGGDGVDVLFGEDGNDVLSGDAGDDQLIAGSGNDTLVGGNGINSMWGDDGNDILIGGASTDYLIGGAGDDILAGGDGNDFYYFQPGGGVDHISDSGGTDWLVLSGITWDQLVLGIGSLKLGLPDGSEIHLDDFDPANPMAGAIENFQFGDGRVMTRQQLIQALGFQIQGTPQNDELTGTALGDSIQALDGDDTVNSDAGNDTVNLGEGQDYADGGAGDDFVVGAGGDDTVLGNSGNDMLDGGAGADTLYGNAGDDQLFGGADDDKLSGGAGTDRLEGGDGNDIYYFGVGSGQDLVIDATGTNAIQLTGGLAEAQVSLNREGQNLVLSIAGTTDQLTVQNWFETAGSNWWLALGDGAVLDRASVEERLAKNLAPVLVEDNGTAKEDTAVQVVGNVLSNDADPEGRALRVTTTGTLSGSYGTLALSANGAFTYTLNNSAAVQSLAEGQSVTDRFSYTATDDDPAGASSAASAVVITVVGTNDVPVAFADDNYIAEDDVSTTGNVLLNDFDQDTGVQLAVAAPGTHTGAFGTLMLAANGNYEYTLNNSASAVQSLGRNAELQDHYTYTVTDGTGSSTGSIDITIAGRNDAPVVASPLADQTATPNRSYSWQVPAGSFTDVDTGDVLTFEASLADGSPLPDWLSFNPDTRTFSGQVPGTATGYIDIQVTATDHATQIGETSTPSVVFDSETDLSVADVFRLSFGAANGGGHGDKGNEGVGNGEDPPPPGHDNDFNDGEGTSPGNPGAKGGNGYGKTDNQLFIAASADPSKVPQLVHPSLVTMTTDHERPTIFGKEMNHRKDHAQSIATSHDNNGQRRNDKQERSMQSTSELGGSTSTHSQEITPSGSESITGSFIVDEDDQAAQSTYIATDWNHGKDIAYAEDTEEARSDMPTRWSSVDDRLIAHLASSNGGSGDNSNEGGTADLFGGVIGSGNTFGTDPLAVAAGKSKELPTFKGLQEGFRQVGQ